LGVGLAKYPLTVYVHREVAGVVDDNRARCSHGLHRFDDPARMKPILGIDCSSTGSEPEICLVPITPPEASRRRPDLISDGDKPRAQVSWVSDDR
jgi:hypothetical protein